VCGGRDRLRDAQPCLHPPEECPQPTRGVVGAGCRQPPYCCRTASGRAGSAAQPPAHLSRVVITVLTPAGQQAGLFTDSVVMTDNLATVAEVAIDQVIGTLPMVDEVHPLAHGRQS